MLLIWYNEGAMISYLFGKIKYKNEKFVILDVNGVGYQVFISPSTFEKIGEQKEIALYTNLHVTENVLELYGFLSVEELEFFEQLLTVTGVGPKSALNIMSAGKIEEIKKAIIHGDPSILTKVSGIGQKTAERLILELKNKISIETEEGGKINLESIGDHEAITALVKLGYTAAEAREVLRDVDEKVTKVEERVKEALKLLGRK